MKHALSLSMTIAACALVGATLGVATPAGQSSGQAPAAAPAPADDPAAPLFTQMCNECHDAERIVATRRTRPEWQDTLLKMIEKGAKGGEKDFETVFAYLLRHYGKVYINSAGPDEIATVTGLSSRDAEAIVAARTASGAFADFDALRRVPDIDVKTLDAHKDAIAF